MSSHVDIKCKLRGCPFHTYEGHYCDRIKRMNQRNLDAYCMILLFIDILVIFL
jgi:hypothetical protein